MPFQPVSLLFILWFLQAYLVPISPQFHVTPANIAYSCLGGFTVIVRPFSRPQWVGLTMIPQFGMFSLLIREKVNNSYTLGSPAIAQPFAAVHRRSHLGIPLRDHHWYAIKRGDRVIAHVVWSFTRPLRGAHILTS